MCQSTHKLRVTIDVLHSSLRSHLRVFLEEKFVKGAVLFRVFRGTCLISVSAGS
jgi:hypothetical protein